MHGWDDMGLEGFEWMDGDKVMVLKERGRE